MKWMCFGCTEEHHQVISDHGGTAASMAYDSGFCFGRTSVLGPASGQM